MPSSTSPAGAGGLRSDRLLPKRVSANSKLGGNRPLRNEENATPSISIAWKGLRVLANNLFLYKKMNFSLDGE